MKSSSSLAILSLIFLLSSLSATLLYFYMDPERNLIVAYVTMGVALFLSIASFLSMFLYGIKRVYYRGITNSWVLHASIRQGFFLALGTIGLVVFLKIGILGYRTGWLLFLILFLFELMIQSISNEE